MKLFPFDYPWSDRKEWFIPDDEEMMQGQFPILDEQINYVLDAVLYNSKDKLDDRRRTCVQAGGAFGLYPLRLADYFEKVWTFEPLMANLQCMAANLGECSEAPQNITVSANALWYKAEKLQMMYSKPVKNSYGAHHVSARGNGIGETVIAYPLDDWTIDEVDLIWLDIEGAEVFALNGAADTIKRCKPVVVVETRTLPQMKELGVTCDSASDWLKKNGYQYYGRTHGDLVFVPA